MRLPWLAALLLAGSSTALAAAVHFDIDYDDGATGSTARRLDVYTPTSQVGVARPVVIYVHGGGWARGDKAKVFEKPAWLADRGIILVSVAYRLGPQGAHPAAAADLAAALAWTTANIADYGGDPEALFLLGHSTGGHLVSLVATDPRFLGAHGLSPAALRGVVCLDTNAFDLETLVRLLPPENRQLYFDAFGSDSADLREASPSHHVAPDREIPPFLLLVSGVGASTHWLGGRFAGRLAAAGVDVALEVFPNQTHASINTRLGTSAHPPTRSVERFIDRLAPQRPPRSLPGSSTTRPALVRTTAPLIAAVQYRSSSSEH